jgi:hypothetical protein
MGGPWEGLGGGHPDELETQDLTGKNLDLGGEIFGHAPIVATVLARGGGPCATQSGSPRGVRVTNASYTHGVLAAVVLASVAAVLAPQKVVFVDTTHGTVVQTVRLSGQGIAIFAAPDARVVVPLEDQDATEVVSPAGKIERWPGRVFPVFSRDYDRMQVVLPGMFATLSYPERLPLIRIPLLGVTGAIRAASSEDGRLVAVIPSGVGGRTLLIVAATEGGTARAVELGGEATAVVMADEGRVAVTANGTTLEAAVLGEVRARQGLSVGGEVRSLCRLATGRDILAGLASGGAGAVVGLRVNPKASEPLRERFRTPLPAPVVALAAAGEDIVAISGADVVVLTHKGRRVARTLPVPDARDIAVLPRLAKSAVPNWGDLRGR